MITARWEILRTFQPWAAPQAGLLGPPIASGMVDRDDYDPANQQPIHSDSLFAPTDPIVVPADPDGAAFLMLSVDVFGWDAWYLTIAPPGQTPQASDGNRHAVDPHPTILIPSPGNTTNGGRSREVRAVRPGSSFILQPLRATA